MPDDVTPWRPPPLFDHQIPIVAHLASNPRAAIWLGMGYGKTLSTLSSFLYTQPQGHILVIAPINIARSTWTDEIKKYDFPLRTRSLIVDERDRKLTPAQRKERYAEIIDAPATMYFINRDLIVDLINYFPTYQTAHGLVRHWPFPTVIVDEAQSVKNPKGVRFKALADMVPATQRFIQLTGTPAPNGLLDLWAQMFLLDGGAALGRDFEVYKAIFFEPDKYVDHRPVSWVLREGAEEAIYDRIKHLVMSSHSITLELPPLTITQVHVTLDTKAQKQYDTLARDAVLEILGPDGELLDEFTAANSAVLRARLLQLSSGTLYNQDKEYTVFHSEKITMLDSILKQDNTPTLVAYWFQSDREELKSELTRLGHKVEIFNGSKKMIDRWNAGEIPVLLLQPASAGHGLNLQMGGHTLVWYSLPDSSELYLQTIGRLVRIGQLNPVQVYILLTRRTWDMKQPLMLANKNALEQRLIHAVSRDQLSYREIDDLNQRILTMDNGLLAAAGSAVAAPPPPTP